MTRTDALIAFAALSLASVVLWVAHLWESIGRAFVGMDPGEDS